MAITSLGGWLIALMVICPVIFIYLNVLLAKMYLAKSETGTAWIPKIVIVVGLMFAEIAVLLMPLDVANRSGTVGCQWKGDACGGLDLSGLWLAVAIIIMVFALFIIPLTIFYYEAFDVDKNFKETTCAKQCCSAMKYQIVTMVVLLPIFIILYTLLGTVRIPIKATNINASYTGNFNSYTPGSFSTIDDNTVTVADFSGSDLAMQCTVAVFMIAFFSFFGWVFFIIYAGIGLVALPVDNIIDYKRRPTLVKPVSYTKMKEQMSKRAAELGELGEQLRLDFRKMTPRERGKAGKEHKKAVQKLEQAVLLLERDWEELKLCQLHNYMNPSCGAAFLPFVQLGSGIIGIIISLLWLLHICLYMLPYAWGGKAITPFLNTYLTWFDTWFSLFGIITIGLFVFYLQLCVIKGAFKFGMRFTLIELHPMRYGKTLSNSFLFNIMLILICTIPVLQFSADAFSSYIRFTDMTTILNIQVRYVDSFRPFFKNQIFVAVLVGFSLLTALYALICGKSRVQDTRVEELKQALDMLDKRYKKKGLSKKTAKNKEGKTFQN